MRPRMTRKRHLGKQQVWAIAVLVATILLLTARIWSWISH